MSRIMKLTAGCAIALALGACDPRMDTRGADGGRKTNPAIASRTTIHIVDDNDTAFAEGQMKPGHWNVYPTDPTKCTFKWVDGVTKSSQSYGPFRADETVVGFDLPHGSSIGFFMTRACDHARWE